ncbi:Hyaluronidase, partial [Operophtera brumata]
MRPPKISESQPTVVNFHVTVMGLDSIDENSMKIYACGRKALFSELASGEQAGEFNWPLIYYVIEMPEALPTHKPFKVYWNVPTKQCKSKKIPFSNLYEKFGIIQNAHDHFSGEKVTILYDPGLFPALLKNETSGRFKFRNGG